MDQAQLEKRLADKLIASASQHHSPAFTLKNGVHVRISWPNKITVHHGCIFWTHHKFMFDVSFREPSQSTHVPFGTFLGLAGLVQALFQLGDSEYVCVLGNRLSSIEAPQR